MAIKHIEIQHNGNVDQSSLDEIYIAMDNLDETSKVEGDVTIGNYTPMVVDKLESNFSGLHITPTGKKYIEINPKDRAIQKEFSKYSDDDSGHVTEEAAAKVTSLSISTSVAEVWDLDDWYDKFEKVASIPSFNTTGTKESVKYTGGTKRAALQYLRNVKHIRFQGVISQYGVCSASTVLETADFSGTTVLTTNTNLGTMFHNCSNLKELNLSGLDTSSVSLIGFEQMFRGCKSLEGTIDLSLSVLPSQAKSANLGYMFAEDEKLECVDMSNWNLSSSSTISTMFSGCTSLQTLKALGCPKDTVSLFKAALNNANRMTTDLQHDSFTYTDDELAIKYSDLAAHPNLEPIKKLGVGEQGISKVVAEKTTAFPASLVTELKTKQVIDFRNWYNEFTGITYLPAFTNDTVMTEFYYEGNKWINLLAFDGCSNLTKARIKAIFRKDNASTSVGYFFRNCKKIKELNLKGSNFSTCTSNHTSQMFDGCSAMTKLDLSYTQWLQTGWNFFNAVTARIYMIGCSLKDVKLLYSVKPSLKFIIGYLGTDKVGEDGTNWTYDSFDEETPDESLMACYDQALYDYMVSTYGETDALTRVPSKEDYLNSRG